MYLKPTPRFAVYFVDFVKTDTTPALEGQARDLKYKNMYVTQEYFRTTAVVRGKPILTEADIVEYCWEKQHIVLKPESANRWNESFIRDTPLAGSPIQILVDGKPQYGACVFVGISTLGGGDTGKTVKPIPIQDLTNK